MLSPAATDTKLKLLKSLRLSKNLSSCKGSRTGNSANNLELKVLTQIQYVPWHSACATKLIETFWSKKANERTFWISYHFHLKLKRKQKWFTLNVPKNASQIRSRTMVKSPRLMQRNRAARQRHRAAATAGAKMLAMPRNGNTTTWPAINVTNSIICISAKLRSWFLMIELHLCSF